MRSPTLRAASLACCLVLWPCTAGSLARPLGFAGEVTPEVGAAGAWTSVAMDALGRAHVAWADAAAGALRYAWQVPGGWRNEVIEHSAAGPVGWYASLALDADGVAHVAYYDAVRGVLKHAERRGDSWSVEVVDATPGAGHYCALALTPRGEPAVSYYDATALCLRYAEKVGRAWVRETVDGAQDATEAQAAEVRADRDSKTPAPSQDVPNVGTYTSLAIGRDGSVHISYQDVTNADLKLAVKRGGAWALETVDAKGDVGEHTSLKLTGDGRVRVSYYDLQNGALKLASERADGTWRVETVDAAGDVGAYASLALDGNGGEHVSYLDAAHGALKYAERVPGGGWVVQQVDGEGEAGRHSSLALDRSGAPVIAYTARGARGVAGAFRLIAAGVQSGGSTADDAVGSAPGPVLSAWPLPYRGGLLHVSLALGSAARGTGAAGEVAVVDIAGRHVRSLAPAGGDAGQGSLTWDGRDDAGHLLASGVYFLVGRSGGRESRLKLIVLE